MLSFYLLFAFLHFPEGERKWVLGKRKMYDEETIAPEGGWIWTVGEVGVLLEGGAVWDHFLL